MNLSEIERLALLPDDEIARILDDLGPLAAHQLLYDWGWNARPKQKPPKQSPPKQSPPFSNKPSF